MELFLKLFPFFILGLLIMWGIFISVVLILKSRIKPKSEDLESFKDKYSDLEEAIERKKKEIQQ
jgi:hypothetical protein